MAAAPQKEEATTTAKGGKKKLFLIIGLALLLVLVSVGGTLAALKFFAPSTPAAGSSETSAEAEPEPLAPPIYYEMTPNFTINFNVNGRQRYLQAGLTLMYRDESLEPLLKLHMPAIRNGLVLLLSSKNFDELQTAEGKEKLRKEALDVVQNVLKKEQEAKATKEGEEPKELPSIEQVLFTNFVMQ